MMPGAPDPTTGERTRDLAERVMNVLADALLEEFETDAGPGCDGGPVPYVEGQPYDMAGVLVAALAAAGMAVVVQGETAEVFRLIRKGIGDPGATVCRGKEQPGGGGDYTETLISWESRAVAGNLCAAGLLAPGPAGTIAESIA